MVSKLLPSLTAEQRFSSLAEAFREKRINKLSEYFTPLKAVVIRYRTVTESDEIKEQPVLCLRWITQKGRFIHYFDFEKKADELFNELIIQLFLDK